MTQEALGQSFVSSPLGAYISKHQPPHVPVVLTIHGDVERGLRHPCHLQGGTWEALGQVVHSKHAMGPGNATWLPSAAPSASLLAT